MPGEVIVSMDYRGELTYLIESICLILYILNARVLTQTLLGFYHYRSLWDEGISNDLNDLRRKTSHIFTIILNARR